MSSVPEAWLRDLRLQIFATIVEVFCKLTREEKRAGRVVRGSQALLPLTVTTHPLCHHHQTLDIGTSRRVPSRELMRLTPSARGGSGVRRTIVSMVSPGSPLNVRRTWKVVAPGWTAVPRRTNSRPTSPRPWRKAKGLWTSEGIHPLFSLYLKVPKEKALPTLQPHSTINLIVC